MKPPIEQMTDEQLAWRIKMLDAKARSTQSELAHSRRLLKKRKKERERHGITA